MKLKTRQMMVTVAAIAGFLGLGGCLENPKEQTKPINHIASSSTKEDKKVINQETAGPSERTRARNDDLCERT